MARSDLGKRVGLLGGSFNPAHQGHLHISLSALRRLNLDEIWWMVSPQNPLKNRSEMGEFNFRKATLQEITFIGTYCYTNQDFKDTIKILSNKDIGNLDWIEYRELKNGGSAFKQIHDGTCSAPKIVLIP